MQEDLLTAIRLHGMLNAKQGFNTWIRSIVFLTATTLAACISSPEERLDYALIHPEDLLIVDCLLPPQVHQLGSSITYLSRRQPLRTSAAMCAIRGGEYVAYDRADFNSALSVWQPLAERGDPQAQTYVGEIYENGLGTRESYEKAAYWYQRAVDQGFARAKINLGYLHESGQGVDRDLIKALNLYRDAAGFTPQELEFVSSIEKADRAAIKADSVLLKDHAQQLQQQLASTQHQFTALQETISEKNQQVIELQARIKQQLVSVNATKPKLPESTADQPGNSKTAENNESENLLAEALKEKDNKIARLTSLLAEKTRKEKILRELKNQLNDRVAELDQNKVLLNRVQEELHQTAQSLSLYRQDAADEPVGNDLTIDIIDPPVLLTRSYPILTVNPEHPVDIIGKVNPVESLFALRINGTEQATTKNGLFHYTRADTSADDINIVAIDKIGNSTRLALKVGMQNTDIPKSVANAVKTQSQTQPSISSLDFGRYTALIIGNNDYQHLGNLKTAHNDAQVIEQVLREQYGFKTELLIDANRQTMLSALDRLRVTLTDRDNLIIYYAGHGDLDDDGHGYWLPVDADPQNTDKWISNKAIARSVDAISAKHVLVLADSCFSGTLTRTSIARPLPEVGTEQKYKWLQAVSNSRVRTALSSGGIKPVLDGSTHSEHSLFAGVLIDTLMQNEGIVEAYRVFLDVQRGVSLAAAAINIDQVPQYSPIKHTGHEAGEFLFVPVRK